LPGDLPPERERWGPSLKELARIEAAAHRGIRPPTRIGATGREVLVGAIDGAAGWVTLPPWIPPEALEATPEFNATARSPGTPRTFLTTAPDAAIQEARCPFARCADEHVQRATGVGKWTAVFESPGTELSKRIAAALVFTPGPAGYIHVRSRSKEVRVTGSAVVMRGGRASFGVDTTCRHGPPNARVVRRDVGNAHSFCADGFQFFLGSQPRDRIQAYAETVVVRRLP
jgi:hypothetical protein